MWLLIPAGLTCAVVTAIGLARWEKAPVKASSAEPVRSAAAELVGRASVIDGDTIEINRERVRFNGIDAPELAQRCLDASSRSYRCGAEAARFLDELLAASRPTRCQFVARDQYGRFVGQCFRNDGVDVSQALVQAGYAFDWAQYSHGAFASDEAVAQRGAKGLWRGEFQKPWDYRHRTK